MRILVTGGSGLLGRKLVEELLNRGHQVIAIYNRHPIPVEHSRLEKHRLDITDRVRLEDLVLKKRPDTVIHSAAYTDVDGCEENREKAWRVNVEATRTIARAARVVGAHLVYVSTDYVFDGEKGLYHEDDTPNPVNYYGLTKLVAEEIVRSTDILHTVVRTSAVYGIGGAKKSFAEYIAEKLSQGERVYALTDQYVSPTLNTLLAKAIAEIAELKPMGTLHVAGERMSRHQFATRIAEALGLPTSLIEKATMKDMKHWKAKRPRDSSLDTTRARNTLKTRFHDTSLAIRTFKEEWQKTTSPRAGRYQ